MSYVRAYIGGQWIRGDSSTPLRAVVNPWSGTTLWEYVEATSDDVSQAVRVAGETMTASLLAAQERNMILGRVADLLAAEAEPLAQGLCEETGKPIRDARIEVTRATTTFRLAAAAAQTIHGYTEDQASLGSDRVTSVTMREPLGVVAAITPFNFPLNLVAHKVAPALAAGNSIVLKPAEATPRTAIALVEILERAGLPAGFCNLVLGGPAVGEALLADPRVALYTFTGSVAAGLRVKQQSTWRPVILELGSNSPNIVHEDADVPMAVDLLVKSAFSYAGQVCISAQRIYVHHKIWTVFCDRFMDQVHQLTLGDPADAATDLGPMINEAAAARVQQWISQAVEGGAELLSGGTREGNRLAPTVLAHTDPAEPVMCAEAFGPVVNLVPYHQLSEVIAACNDSTFGLQAGVFTSNLHVAWNVARALDVGGVNINQPSSMRVDSMPYGGVKHSGIGREGPLAAIQWMTREKVLTWRYRADQALS